MKTAQKIIDDLRDKVAAVVAGGALSADVSAPMAVSSEVYTEAVAALGMLGFGKAASEKVVKKVLKENPSAEVEVVIRLALKQM